MQRREEQDSGPMCMQAERGRLCCGDWKQEDEKEEQADVLLRMAAASPDYPAYTEARLRVQSVRHWSALTETLEEVLERGPSVAALDEIRFLASMTALSRLERVCLRGWILGLTQQETGVTWAEALGGPEQWRVSRALRSALHKCYEVHDLGFAAFCRHAIYRRPGSRNRPTWKRCYCPRCREEFPWGLGAGPYCSQGCRDALHRERAERRREGQNQELSD